MKKETNKQKIDRYYTISRINTKYRALVIKHMDWILSDAEFIFESDRIYNWSWRKDFISLEQVRDETRRNDK